MYELSFSERFFYPENWLAEIEPSDKPTTVLQAIISLPEEEKKEIAIEFLGCNPPAAKIYIESESFPYDVLNLIKKTNMCDSLESPIEVYIDQNQNYSVVVFEDKNE